MKLNGNKIKKYRLANNITQDIFAKKIGVHKITLSKWERIGHNTDFKLSVVSRIIKTYPDILNVITKEQENNPPVFLEEISNPEQINNRVVKAFLETATIAEISQIDKSIFTYAKEEVEIPDEIKEKLLNVLNSRKQKAQNNSR